MSNVLGSARLTITLKDGAITVFGAEDDNVLWHAKAELASWDLICQGILDAAPDGCGAMRDDSGLRDPNRAPHADDTMDCTIWFKKSYLTMFSKEQWIFEIDYLVEDDYKRYRCRCQVRRKFLDKLKKYSSSLKVHGIACRAEHSA